jgi:hypothetical protein
MILDLLRRFDPIVLHLLRNTNRAIVSDMVGNNTASQGMITPRRQGAALAARAHAKASATGHPLL